MIMDDGLFQGASGALVAAKGSPISGQTDALRARSQTWHSSTDSSSLI